MEADADGMFFDDKDDVDNDVDDDDDEAAGTAIFVGTGTSFWCEAGAVEARETGGLGSGGEGDRSSDCSSSESKSKVDAFVDDLNFEFEVEASFCNRTKRQREIFFLVVSDHVCIIDLLLVD